MVKRSREPSAVISLSTSAVRSGSCKTAGPSSYVASRPSVPSSFTTGSRERREVSSRKASGNEERGGASGRKPLEMVMVNGSKDDGKVEGLSRIWGNFLRVEEGRSSNMVIWKNRRQGGPV